MCHSEPACGDGGALSFGGRTGGAQRGGLALEGAWPGTTGKVYERLCKREPVSYSAFHERLRNLENLRLVDMAVRQEKGRTRVIEVREGVEEVLQVPAGSSGAPSRCSSGVFDDEKCRYEGGRR